MLLICLAGFSQAGAQRAFPDSASTLFHNLAGRWSCVGGFARGGSLAADMTFTLEDEGRTLAYKHTDHPPGVYWQRSTWGVQRDGSILSVGAIGTQKDYFGSPMLYVGRVWSAQSLRIEADTIKAAPTPNRFTYTLLAADRLKMVWEILRNGAWSVGDSLLCGRQ